MLAFLFLYIALEFAACFAQEYGPNSYYYRESGYSFKNHEYCDDLSPYYGDINLEQIAGVWYGVEKIPHTKGEYRIEHTGNCFYIDIKEQHIMPTPPTPYPPSYTSSYLGQNQGYNGYSYGYHEPHRVRHFVLEWHEGIWQEDYHVKVNTSHKGFWTTDVPSRAVDHQYRFFGGVIQVLKVSNNHLVLNFCMRLPNTQLYSVVLSRFENQLTHEDLVSIHNVFTIKHLSTSALQRVCENSGAQLTMSILLLVGSVLLWCTA